MYNFKMRLYFLSFIFLWFLDKTSNASFLPEDPLTSEILVRQQVTLERQKRYLLYPDGDPARVQLIIGLGVPVDLEDQSVTIGYVIKILYHIPQVASDYYTNAINSASLVRAFGANAVVVEGNKTIGSFVTENDFKSNVTNVKLDEYDDDYDERNMLKEKFKSLTQNDEDENVDNLDNPENIIEHNVQEEQERKQNENVKMDYLDVAETDGDYREELTNEDESGRIRRDGERKNANSIIKNNHKDSVDERVFMYSSEGETIREKEYNDGYKVMTTPRDDGLEGVESDDLINAPKTTRWDLYKVFENMMEQKGYEGRACMLRAICEAAETPFTHKNGVLGELLHILLTPSSTNEKISDYSDKDYHTAEFRGGVEDIECQEMYPECEDSVLEMFSEIGWDYFKDSH